MCKEKYNSTELISWKIICDLTYLTIWVRTRQVVAIVPYERRLTHCSWHTNRKHFIFHANELALWSSEYQPNNSGNSPRFFVNLPKLRMPFLCINSHYVVKKELFLLMRLPWYLYDDVFCINTEKTTFVVRNLTKSDIPRGLLLYTIPGYVKNMHWLQHNLKFPGKVYHTPSLWTVYIIHLCK